MTNIDEQKNNQNLSRKSLSDRFFDTIKNVGEQENEVVQLVRDTHFADPDNGISGLEYDSIALTDDDGNTRIMFKATSGAQLIPNSKEKLVRRLKVISVGTTGANTTELINLFKSINDAS